jgi:septal ring factor EnvC (AmiA/AmiB activator)
MTRRQSPEQLDLPISLTEASRLQQELAQAEAYINDIQTERDNLKTQYARLSKAFNEIVQSSGKRIDEQSRQISRLQTQCDFLYERLKTDTRPSRAVPTPGHRWIRDELTKLLAVCHPDKWHGNPAAEELTKHVIVLRGRVQKGML